MNRTAFIVHGTEGYPGENWFPWLKGKLEEKGVRVFVPQFPTPPVVPAKLDEWFSVFGEYEKYFDPQTLLFGHSLGGVFSLRILEKLENSICATFLVGAPVGVQPILNFERDKSFSGFEFDWGKIRKNGGKFFVFQSDNDPYVGLENGKELARNVGVELSFVPNAGHFNAKAGYFEFPQLWEKVLEIL